MKPGMKTWNINVFYPIAAMLMYASIKSLLEILIAVSRLPRPEWADSTACSGTSR